jgi:phosphoglycolate phosphatase-like HAD superfamily hydrolase
VGSNNLLSKLIENIILKENIISQSKVIFWDFDGVIKNSVEVKSDAFEQMFEPFGAKLANKIKLHHESNGGMSRLDKLPIYLSWAGIISPSNQLIDEYAENFSLLVKHKVIKAEWVAGVLDFLQNNYKRKQFFLITATPQKEIEDILKQLKIIDYFDKVVGSPTKKNDAINVILSEYLIPPKDAVMIGDSGVDYHASRLNKVKFVLRKTNLNKALQEAIDCQMVSDFKDLL